LAKKYVEHVRDQPNWKSTTLANQVLRDHNVMVSRSQTYRGKKKAIMQIEGSHAQQISQLWSYYAAIREHKLGSRLKLKLENSYFQRLYVCLDA